MTNNKTLDKQLVINIAEQTLTMYQQQTEVVRYVVSTAKNGIGSQQDSVVARRSVGIPLNRK